MFFKASPTRYTQQQYLGFFRKAKTVHHIDSPFVYRFVKYVVEDHRNFYIFPLGRLLHREARDQISHPEFYRYSISSSVGKKLFRAIHLYKPDLALVLGAGDGLGPIYLATAMLSGDLMAIEPDAFWYAFAKKQIEALGLPNVTLLQDHCGEALTQFVKEIDQIDFLLVHASISPDEIPDLFDLIQNHLHHQSIVAVHLPYQSASAKSIWQSLCEHPKVQLSIDLFDLGFLFFDPALRKKQHYRIVPASRKFWQLGLFR